LATRSAVQHGWQSVADKLVLHGDRELAAKVARFARRMDLPLTERESMARVLSAHVRAQQQEVRTR
jgi:type III secretion system FlhB-like substrate exporter